ncbi:cyclic nucleotide-binding domain-containing protein [Leucothrix sargassi]|nr:cyclic nucleotide-binding domain-containing protein [Leucothrix sargassi]
MPATEKHNCSVCSFKAICLPTGVCKQDLERLEALIQDSKVHHSGDVVIRQDSAFHKLFAVKSGMYKSVKLNDQGEERVIGFHLPGDIIGLDAVYPKAYTSSVVALTSSVLCQFDYDQLVTLSAKIPSIQHQLMRLSSKEINIANAFQNAQTAEQKLAGFIHNLSARNAERGYSSSQLILSMSRQDIASHLGMAPETISRVLKQFQANDILMINKREMQILDPSRLLISTGCTHA